ncbi:MAG TPA: S49 family peptidase, partial [Candidatus Cloacimonadota bacterium]|nr:S49 family peptidase [Candidatus Cloacimonadota bacterium]
MSKNTKIILLVLAVLLILIGLSYWSGKQLSKFSMTTTSTTTITEGTWLRLNPSAMVADYSEVLPLSYFGSAQSSVESLTRKIRSARDDKRIKGIIIEPSFVQLSLPSLKEIGLALEEFKASGKPVKGFGDLISQADYMLLCYADEIYMEPSASAGMMLSGTSSNVQFYKELLDKLGVKMHVIQAGEFKGAGEPYNQTKLSEGTRANIAAALSDRFDLIVEHISAARKLNPDEVKAIFNDRKDFFLSANAAQEMLLIDFPMAREEMLSKLEIKDDKLVSMNDYSTKREFPKGDKIAIVYLSGNITPGTGSFNQGIISHSKVKKITEQIRQDKSVKAVVLRVNSPGGSALESELIYQDLLKLRKDIPIVISMGGVAASGGYYISCGGNYIMADEGSITGSIGVIMLLPETTNLGKKIGIRSQTIKYGKYAGTFSMF